MDIKNAHFQLLKKKSDLLVTFRGVGGCGELRNRSCLVSHLATHPQGQEISQGM